jgi:hypothetical protein
MRPASLSADRERFEFLRFLLEFVDALLQHVNDGVDGVTLRIRLAHDLLALGLHNAGVQRRESTE